MTRSFSLLVCAVLSACAAQPTNKELARDPSYHAAHFGLAAAYFQLGDFASAEENLTAAMQNGTTRRDHELYAAKLERLRSNQVR